MKKPIFLLVILALILLCCAAAADTLTLPASLTEIEEEAFLGDTSITEVVLPERLEVIGDRAFMDCDNLQAIHIPQSVWSIGQDALPLGGVPDGLAQVKTRILLGRSADRIHLVDFLVPEGIVHQPIVVGDQARGDGIMVREIRRGIGRDHVRRYAFPLHLIKIRRPVDIRIIVPETVHRDNDDVFCTRSAGISRGCKGQQNQQRKQEGSDSHKKQVLLSRR